MEDGELYLVGAGSSTSISRVAISGGELDTDATYLASCDGVTPNSGTVLNFYTDVNGDEAILYVNRSTALKKLAFSGDDFIATTVTLPNKGNCNGAFPFVWDGMELVVYPTLNNYRDGFAVAQLNAAEPLVYVPQTATSDANGYQANWLNAEVTGTREVMIYQYYPGGHLTVWRLTKQGGVMRGDVDDDGAVNISDVTALINYLLTDDAEGVNLANADCDLDENINISDVTALISYLLTDAWPE